MKRLLAVFIIIMAGSYVQLTHAQEGDANDQALAQLKQLQQLARQRAQTPRVAPPKATSANAQATQNSLTVAPPRRTGADAAARANIQQITSRQTNQALDEAAFRQMIRGLMPLSPAQILRLKQMYYAQQFAASATPGTPPKPTATSQMVNLSPGSTPPVIRLSQGYVTSLVFLDSSSQPWPIKSYALGNPKAFNIQWDKKSNTLVVQALDLYTTGNLAVQLHGLNTPVMLTMVSGQKAVDYRVDLRVQGYGPNAKQLPVGLGLPGQENPVLLSILDGVPPPGGKELNISGGSAQAWIQGSRMFVRTRLDVISPGWLATMSSADGMHAYQMQKAPLLLVSHNGKIMQLKIEGF